MKRSRSNFKKMSLWRKSTYLQAISAHPRNSPVSLPLCLGRWPVSIWPGASIKSGITVAVTVTVPTAHHTTDTDMGAGITVMTMCTDVNSVEIKAAAVWIDGNSHSKSHETSKPQGASIVPWGTFLPIRLQARVLGYSHRPSVTKSRVRLQLPGRHRRLYP